MLSDSIIGFNKTLMDVLKTNSKEQETILII